MSSTPEIGAEMKLLDAIFESLVAKGGRSTRRNNLSKIHSLCRSLFNGGHRDFSLATMAKMIESEGILKGRALYNYQSEDYRKIIEAWRDHVGSPPAKPAKLLASHEYLMRIGDPAIRSLMQATVVERDKLKAQLNILKGATEITVDRRRTASDFPTASGTPSLEILAPSAQLTASEVDALQKSISSEFLEERGLKEGSHGEIVNKHGRVIFEFGFARAIRKILHK